MHLAADVSMARNKPVPEDAQGAMEMTTRNSRAHPVSDYMTQSPHSVGKDQTLARAHAVMREHRIRHLPVLDAGQLVGVVTLRDLHLLETLHDVDPEEITVEEAMNTTVYSVPPDAPLADVCAEMATKKYGSAVVLEGSKVTGILTTVDVCRTLAELLRRGEVS
jgi:acetoin utilization protein AcuB